MSKNITTQWYRAVFLNTFLPCGNKLFSVKGTSNWELQQDNDPTHKPAMDVVKYWGIRHSSSPSTLEDWPPSSPDLSIIENCWAYVQRRLDAQVNKTFKDFKAAAVYEVQHIPSSMFRKCFRIMPKTVAKVLELNGERLNC